MKNVRPTFKQMVKQTEEMILNLAQKGKFPSDGQLVVLVREVLFPKQRLTISEAEKLIITAQRSLNIK